MGWFNHQPDHPPKRVWDEKDSSLKWPGKPWHIENIHNESQLFIYIMRWSFLNHCRSTALLVSSTTLWSLLVTLELWDPLVLQKKIQRSLIAILPASSCLEQPKKRFHAKPNGNQKTCKPCLLFSSSWQFWSWWRKSKTFKLNPSIDFKLGKMFSLYLRPKKNPIPSMGLVYLPPFVPWMVWVW